MTSSPLPRVLLVVADDALADRAERLLTGADVAVVGRVRTASAASDVVAETSPDCAVVSDGLPDASLPATIEAFDEVPVVAVRAGPESPASERLFDAGAVDVVVVDDTNLFDRLGDRVASVVAWRRSREAAVARISEELKEQAMDEAPVGITIADFSLPDQPLVYVNEAFESLTGYSEGEALGRNCRYLQGPATDPDPVAELRRAVDTQEATSVELQNYRRDGSPFWNRVDIAPLHDADGEVTHYVGFQTDITERVLAEKAAERYAAIADRERDRLQRLVDHIEGLLEDVTSVLVRAETREELEREVCERVAATDSYGAAWLDDCDLPSDTIDPKQWAGAADASVVGLTIARDDPDDPVARAVATRTIQTATDVDGRFHGETVVPFDGVVAVPLLHRETLYGVLVVYTDAETVDEQEQVVLGTLGRAVGAAIDAFESRRSLLTDSPLELRIDATDPELPLVRLARTGGCRLAYEGVVARNDGTVLLYVSVTPPDAELDGGVDGVERVRPLRRGEDGGLYEVVLPPESLLSRVADGGGKLVDLSVDASTETAEVTVTVQDRSVARALLDDIDSLARGVRLHSIHEREGPRATHREFAAAVEDELTDKQRTALQLAYLGGFFEWPHGISGDELAEAMDISRPTFHQHLRAAERKVFSQLYADRPN